MNETLMNFANSPMVWVLASVIVIIAIIQSVLFTKIALRAAKEIEMPQEKCKRAFRSGLITAIGPSIGIFIVMVGMMSVIGGPLSWQRLSVIGSAPLELMNAQIGAEVAGVTFGGEDYNMKALALSWITLALGTQGWMWFVILFGNKLGKVRDKIGGNDSKWLVVLSTAAMVGVFSKLSVDKMMLGGGELIASISGLLIMAALSKFVAPKVPLVKEYAVGIAMIGAMVVAGLLG